VFLAFESGISKLVISDLSRLITEETKTEVDTRDSRLRFYFRSPSSHPSPASGNANTANIIAAQSPDRLSVSLYKGSRRIVIPAEHIVAVHFNRAEGYVKVEGDGWAAVCPFLPC
jgi:hypothetical protein